MKIDLMHGDCLELMKQIPDNSIDFCLTDPPYGTTACKWDSVIPFEPMWKELKRIVKDNGAIALFGSEPFSSRLRMSNLKMFKYDWVWEKTKPTGYQICKIKPLSIYENISIFSIGKTDYFPIMIPREKKRRGAIYSTNNQMKISKGGVYKVFKEYTHKFPTNIIKVSNGSQKNKLHPTQKPVALLEYLIKTYTLEGETVLDFTMGSGSTGVAAKNLNRNFIGIEKELKYFEIAKQRIENA